MKSLTVQRLLLNAPIASCGGKLMVPMFLGSIMARTHTCISHTLSTVLEQSGDLIKMVGIYWALIITGPTWMPWYHLSKTLGGTYVNLHFTDKEKSILDRWSNFPRLVDLGFHVRFLDSRAHPFIYHPAYKTMYRINKWKMKTSDLLLWRSWQNIFL